MHPQGVFLIAAAMIVCALGGSALKKDHGYGLAAAAGPDFATYSDTGQGRDFTVPAASGADDAGSSRCEDDTPAETPAGQGVKRMPAASFEGELDPAIIDILGRKIPCAVVHG